MSDYIYLGKIVGTHGIKGELRIHCSFSRKDLVFKPDFNIYIGKEKIKEKIITYRPHKTFDMVTLENYTNINEVLKYIKQDVFIKKIELNNSKDEYIMEELVDYEVFEGEYIGKIIDFMYNKGGNLLKVKNDKKIFYIPFQPYFIKKISHEEKKVWTENAKGLIL